MEAAEIAALMAERFGDSLLLAHVASRDSWSPSKSQQAQLNKKLKSEARRLQGLSDVQIREKLLFGSPYEHLINLGKQRSTRFLVVASLGRIAPSRFLVGSVAERTAEASPVPTLVVRDKRVLQKWASGKRKLRVLVGYDFSEPSDRALAWVDQLCKTGACAATIASIVFPPEERERLGLKPPNWFGKNEPKIKSLLEQKLKAKIKECISEVETEIVVQPDWGRPDYSFLDLAKKSKADLLVVGTHQRHGLSRLWAGSFSRAVLHDAATNVAVVP